MGLGSPRARIVLWFVVTRLLLVAATFIAWPLDRCIEYEVQTGVASDPVVAKVPWKTTPAGEVYYAAPSPVLDAFFRMDSEYYLWLAAFGYGHEYPRVAGFFPGYAMVTGGLARAINAVRGDFGTPIYKTPVVALLAAFVTSNLALLLAALGLYRLARLFVEAPVAESAAIWLLACPVAFFGSAYLGESLFLLFSIESVVFAFKRRMALAALFGCAAAFTRPVGVLIAVPLFLVSLRSRAAGSRVIRDALWLLLVPAGAIAVIVWHRLALGDPWAYFKVQSEFGHGNFPDVASFLDLFRFAGKNTLALVRDGVQVLALLAASGCLFALVRSRRIPAPLSVWAVLLMAVVLLSGHLISLPRYLFAIFPLFIGAALLIPPGRATRGLQAASVALEVAGFVVFMRAWPVLV
jgi:hypothetical protein